jgi:flavin reductase (DIM6/NTAB) family NADH-FMN oxidoreductase RutF
MTEAEHPQAAQIEVIKQVHRQFITGVTVVTVDHDGTPRGLAVNAFASISLDPPKVMVCIQRTSSAYDALFSAAHLAINILAASQIDLLHTFASKSPDKFADVEWTAGRYGSPILPGNAAFLEVEIRERLQASTHTVFIGQVVDAGASDQSPVAYMYGKFYDSDSLTELGGPSA